MKYLDEDRDRDMRAEFGRKNTKPNTLCFSYMGADGIRAPAGFCQEPPTIPVFRSYFP